MKIKGRLFVSLCQQTATDTRTTSLMMTEQEPVVYVVDDNESLRTAIKRLGRAVGLRVETFSSGKEFLDVELHDGPACLVLDVRLPGLSGLDLQREMIARNIRVPVIFITGHGDIPMSVQAIKAGAVEFLTKPFRDQDLLDAINVAIERDRSARIQQTESAERRAHYDSLTPREREVMRLVVAGLLNKQIALDLGTSEKTVKAHRGNVMQKMHASSLAGLVSTAGNLAKDYPDLGILD
jgi:FixJ family two-component response regulator